MANLVDLLPTDFAIEMCRVVNLYTVHKHIARIENQEEKEFASYLHDRLKTFQQFSLCTDYEEALIAYVGSSLNDEQKNKLQEIAKYTKVWAKSTVIEKLINDVDTDMKSMSAIASEIVKMMDGDKSISGFGGINADGEASPFVIEKYKAPEPLKEETKH